MSKNSIKDVTTRMAQDFSVESLREIAEGAKLRADITLSLSVDSDEELKYRNDVASHFRALEIAAVNVLRVRRGDH